jgi:iron(III) transport system substrate-binding protein
MDWALSEKAQELGPLFNAYQIPTNPDAKVPEKSVRLSAVKTIAFDFRWSGENRQPLIGRFSDTIAAPPGTDA